MAWDDDKLDQLFREQLPEAPKAPADEFQRIVQGLGVWARFEHRLPIDGPSSCKFWVFQKAF